MREKRHEHVGTARGDRDKTIDLHTHSCLTRELNELILLSLAQPASHDGGTFVSGRGFETAQ